VSEGVTIRNAARPLSVIATRWESLAVALLLTAIGVNGYLSAVLFALLMQ